jgi:hypothetical protein
MVITSKRSAKDCITTVTTKQEKISLPTKVFFVPVTVIFIITGLTVFERRQTAILTTFGNWIGFGGLDGRRLQNQATVPAELLLFENQ